MMIKRGILVIFFSILVIPLTCAGGFAELNLGKNLELGGYIHLGGGFLTDAPRDRDRGYLEKYEEFPEGFLARTNLTLKSKDGLHYYKFRMTDPGDIGQDYLLQGGRVGLYHVEFEYGQMQNLYSTVNPFEDQIRILLDKWRVAGYVSPLPSVDFFAENTSQQRKGKQPSSLFGDCEDGAFSFTSYLRPIDYSQNDAKIGAAIYRPKFQFRVAYHNSTFEDNIKGFLVRPGAFVSLPPSNKANYVTAEGAVNLPFFKTRITGSYSWGWLSQDDIVFTSDGGAVGGAGLSASTSALDISGVTRPWDKLTLKFSYRTYNFENKDLSNIILQRAFEGTAPLLNLEHYSYFRQTITGAGSYRLHNKVAFDFAYTYQKVDRTFDQGHTSNNTPQVGVRLFPTSWLNLIANYAYSTRKGSNFFVLERGERDTLDLHTFKTYTGDLNRETFNLIAELFPRDNISFSFNFSSFSDDFDNSAFGLLNDRGWSAGADVSWRLSNRVALSLGYDHQEIKTEVRTSTEEISLVTGDDGPLLQTNDSYDTFTAKADFVLIPKKLKLTTGVSYSFSRSNFHSTVIPILKEQFTDFNAFLTYNFNEHWSARVGYIYQSFTVTKEFQELFLSGVPAEADQRLNTLSGFYRDSDVHLVQTFLQYKF